MSAVPPQPNKVFNTTLTTVIVQVGCITPVIIISFLFLGLWLDRMFVTSPLFTIIFIVVAMPVSILVLLAIVRAATKRLKAETKSNSEIPSEGG
ncbi:MAG: AtpZ/AtpI family protein [Chloroflexota bacterium]